MTRHHAQHTPHIAPILEAVVDDRMPDLPFSEGRSDEISADLRQRLISEAAHDLYVRRGYCDGYDLDDWLQAEAAVDHILVNPNGSRGNAE
jgi:Protein of unknown function (DUF2934)